MILATPEAFVVAVEELSVALCPDDGALKATSTDGAGFPNVSATTTDNGAMNGVLIVAVCGLPELMTIEAAKPGLFVSEKLAVATPGTEAVMTYEPALVFAVGTLPVVALPNTSLVTVRGVLNVALGPLPAGAANVTETPATGFPAVSFT